MTSSTTPSLVLAVNLQYTDLDGNNNKFWNVRFDGALMTRHWGRVGATGETQVDPATRAQVEAEINKKLKKGYREVPMATAAAVTVVPTGLDPNVSKFVGWIGLNAAKHIGTYFDGALDSINPGHVEQARRLLEEISNASGPRLMQLANDYYRMIPTKLPSRIDPAREAVALKRSISEQDERLDQLLVAANQAHVAQTASATPLPFSVAHVPTGDTRFGKVVDWVNKTNAHGTKINPAAYYEIEIPWERKRYEACTVDAPELLFHGTALQNVQHILSLGLKVPKSYSNGWMFGPGVYMARNSSKSVQYASSNYGTPRMMFVVESKLGKPYLAPDAYNYLKPPAGFDSVWGKAGHTRSWHDRLRFDELIVYSPEQVTIRGVFCFN